jgi:8-oxo-dGTP pyrophosphatase MutT (NUDIX family)
MTTKSEIVAAVRGRDPVDQRERDCIGQFLAALEQLGEDPADEWASPVHVTVSGVIVGPRGMVLHRHRILAIWVPPGGHVDPGERPEDAVLRETTEETGMRVAHPPAGATLVHVDVHPGPHGHTHLDLRYLLSSDDDPAPPPHESQEVAWFQWPEALAVTEPCMSGLIGHLAAVA